MLGIGRMFGTICTRCGRPFWMNGGESDHCAMCVVHFESTYWLRICQNLESRIGAEGLGIAIAMLAGSVDSARRRMRANALIVFLLGPTQAYCEMNGSAVSPFRSLLSEFESLMLIAEFYNT